MQDLRSDIQRLHEALIPLLEDPLDVNLVDAVANLPDPQPVEGTVLVDNFPAFPSVQPVSGPLTDAQLRATPIPVVQTPANPTSLYRRITASGSTTVKTGPGVLKRLILGGIGANATVTLLDGATVICTGRETANVPAFIDIDVAFTTSLVATLSGNSDITVVYQ